MNQAAGPMYKCVLTFALLIITVTLAAPILCAQTPNADVKSAEPQSSTRNYQTLYLTNVTQRNDATDIVTDLRNMLPMAKVYYVPSQNAISILGTPEDFQLAQKMLADLDRTRKTYRVTYTITENDNGQSTGKRSVALTVVSGEKSELKQGIRIPIVTGISGAGASSQSSEVQYQDVGLTIEARLNGPPDDLTLHTRLAQSNLSEEHSGLGAQDPVIRQATLEGTSTLAQGKPTVLGSLDIPGSTRHEEIEVTTELVR